MRFEILSLIALTVGGSMVSAFDLPSTYCVRVIPQVINALNTDRILDHARSKICEAGCEVTVLDYESKVREMGIQIIKAESEEMGAPELSEQYITLLDSIYKTALETCEAKEFGKKNICDVEPAQGRQVAQCVKRNMLGIMFDQPQAFWSILTTKCEEQYRFFSNEDLWEIKFPGHMEKFAAEQC
ncbi:hypothetical protein ANOM_002107 [Aspergillus nomiae NRRL 13137]|uniref:Uncharacterized protein n=1 Tax=Aspergillus nomiae NRRL (strain ATCC 15546 / NRRL 13137 / CBS 260.88 / M93) TaxID=1509407 RepID=A0A0L1JFG3_ASPN3|nr:uncharacterized protein ANOM_002107 [Aspergillus nomiae NRRL 13137]KNG90118.1 hypothetical protein ANOM_002107 [Aspergillus nomiae NRRL 13137]